MMRLRDVWLVLLGLPAFLGGCSSVPPITPRGQMCEFASYDLAVETPTRVNDRAARPTFADKLNGALRAPLADARTPSSSLLFLPGGSLHGAFGAGFLADWKRAGGDRLPDFKVVTGISTGSILATFAFVDQPESAVAGYTIDRESDLLLPFGGVKDGDPTISSYIALLQKGALADLAPLRTRLRQAIDDGMMRKVAEEGGRGRLLLIGVVDVDTGQAVVLDLTDMARQYVAAADEATRMRKHDCYVEGILASSSAPLAALPVFIDNRMYVDGGVRFGMFSDEIGKRIQPTLADAARPTIYLIINGDQELKPDCGKADPAADCPNGEDPAGNYRGAHAAWNFPQLALRSEGILANQIYRFSEFAIEKGAAERRYAYRSARIEPDLPGHLYPRGPDGQPAPGAKSCADWKKEDAADGKAIGKEPLQFFPKYMRCVIDYGRSRVPIELARWGQGANPNAPANPFN